MPVFGRNGARVKREQGGRDCESDRGGSSGSGAYSLQVGGA